MAKCNKHNSYDCGCPITQVTNINSDVAGRDGEGLYQLAKKLGKTNAPNESTYYNEVVGQFKGKDGNSAYIGANGNWWVGQTDTGVNASAGGAPQSLKYLINS